MAVAIIVLVVALILNLASGAAATYSVKQYGRQAFDENCRKHDIALRESAKKANVYYNPVGHYFEHDRNYDGTPKHK